MKTEKKEIVEYLQLVSFALAEQEYGVDISQVREIIRLAPITKVPKCPDFMEGVINLRSHVIPIIDLRKKLSLQSADTTSLTRIMIVETDSSSIGVIVDEVKEVIRIAKNSIDVPPPMLAGSQTEYIRGIGKIGQRLIVLLDLAKILTTNEKLELKVLEEQIKPQKSDGG